MSARSCVPWLTLFSLLLLTCPVRGAAVDPEDEYLRIYALVQQADTLASGGQSSQALGKYQEAEKALSILQTKYPNWNGQVVSFRLNYVSGKIKSLGAKAPPAAEGTPPPAQSQTAGAASAPAASGVSLKLLEPGAEPRRALRLHPKPGTKQTMELSMKMGMQVKLGQMENQKTELPAMKMTMEATVKDVTADGDISYEVVMGEASIPEGAGVAPEVADAIKTSFAGVKGLSGTGTMSNRGFSKGAQISLPANASPQVRQTMDQMKDTFSRLAPQLPEEPVGVGARWEVRMPVRSQGISLDQTAVCELVSAEGDRITAKSTITQSAGKQKMETPTMPGLTTDLEKMTGQGTGQSGYDLGQLLPLEANYDLKSDMAMSITMNGQKQSMAMKMDLKLQLQSK